MIVLFGPAGSGKSLQGERLAKKHDWRWLSVGQLLREQDDPEINQKLTTGELFSDEFVVELMEKAISAAEADGQEVVLDGYPRDAWQAKWMIKNTDINRIRGAIVLEVPKEELWKRLSLRERADDTKEVIERRWEIYEQNICSILPLLEAQNIKIEKLNGVGSVEDVAARIEDLLEDWNLIDELVQEERNADEKERSYGE